MVYIINSRTARVTQDPVSNNTNNNQRAVTEFNLNTSPPYIVARGIIEKTIQQENLMGTKNGKGGIKQTHCYS